MCPLCVFARQYALNIVVLCNLALNTLAGGDPVELVSHRTARARLAGARWAVHACRVLTFLSWVITLGRASADHCTHALDPSQQHTAVEIWDWSRG